MNSSIQKQSEELDKRSEVLLKAVFLADRVKLYGLFLHRLLTDEKRSTKTHAELLKEIEDTKTIMLSTLKELEAIEHEATSNH